MQFIKNLSISSKLTCGFMCILLFTIAVAIAGQQGLSGLMSRSEKVVLSEELNDRLLKMKVARMEYIQSGESYKMKELQQKATVFGSFLNTGKLIFEGNDVQELVTSVENSLKQYSQILEQFSVLDTERSQNTTNIHNNTDNIISDFISIISELDSKQQNKKVVNASFLLNQYRDISAELTANMLQVKVLELNPIMGKLSSVITEAQSLNSEVLLKHLGDFKQYMDNYHATTTKILAKEDALIKHATDMDNQIDALTALQSKKAAEDRNHIELILFIVTAIAIIMGILLAWWIKHLIVPTLQEAVAVAGQISQGNLTQRISTDRKDEIGQLYNSIGNMSVRLNELMSTTIDSVNHMNSATYQLENLAKKSAKSMQEQYQETDLVATAVNEMTTTVNEVTRNAESAALSTCTAASVVSQGSQMIADAVSEINILAGELNITAEAMEQLKKQTDSVGQILEVIKAVAEQTNLLALNAAIEAARAGEAGRGFAVVADEVRSLASRTQKSATEIEQLILTLQSGADSSLSMMRKSRDKSEENANNAKKVLEVFSEITLIVNDVESMSQQIATAAEEQSQVSEEINRSIIKVRDLAEETSHSASQSTLAIENLSGLSLQLKKSTDMFQVR
ncbi:methyl-accepting chemotaxis protein [Pseudoalteromonas prydzensis]|uniref:methyl-accepting chemotaxis protein n=1 Tax=Pseudoalteromonas prydzensis TaxID=182141 RepID=UPI0007E52562|nr:methyl-accepting chemotaxis protein [Pseudoalteromonas prydzensis]MBE0380291.1 methyl-accepting chemotaxis protein [Pseudoalteromonas prydzensis ACAM 620]